MRYFKIVKKSFNGIFWDFAEQEAHIKISINYKGIQQDYDFGTKTIIDTINFETTEQDINNAINLGILIEITEREYNDFIKYLTTRMVAEMERAEQIALELQEEAANEL